MINSALNPDAPDHENARDKGQSLKWDQDEKREVSFKIQEEVAGETQRITGQIFRKEGLLQEESLVIFKIDKEEWETFV